MDNIVQSIITAVVTSGVLFLLISYIWKSQTERVKNNEVKINGIESNYLKKFDEVNKNIKSLSETIIQKIDESDKETALATQTLQTNSKNLQEVIDEFRVLNKEFTILKTEHKFNHKR